MEPNKPTHQSHRGIIISIIAVVVVAIIAAIIIVLFTSGIIRIGGQPTVSADAASRVCAEYNGDFTEQEAADDSVDTPIAKSYLCLAATNPADAGSLSFTLLVLSDSFEQLESSAGLFAYPPHGIVLEDSDDFKKAYYKNISDGTYSYTVLYEDTVLMLNASDINFAEQVLVELGYPARSQITTADEIARQAAEVADNIAYDDRMREALTIVATAVNNYKVDYSGQLPAIVTEEGMEQQYVDGATDTALDVFYNDYFDPYGLVDRDGDPYILQFVDHASDKYAVDGFITIHYAATCADGILQDSAAGSDFAVTYLTADEQSYLCVSGQ